jgi:nicotinamide-nucleotide amidase
MTPKIALICIGNEILSGQVQDSNSSFIGQQLQSIGLALDKIYTIADEPESIIDGLKVALQSADLVLTTGGLGPTKDDKTKLALTHFFEDELVFDAEIYAHLAEILASRKLSHLLEGNRGQAMRPKNAQIFLNHNGTAPAICFAKGQQKVICLPGVPMEVKHFFRMQITAFLQATYQSEGLLSQSITCSKIPESILSQKLEAWENSLPKHIALSYLPQYSRVKLVLSAKGKSAEILRTELDTLVDELKLLIPEHVMSYHAEHLEGILGDLLQQQGLSIATAESCTSGKIAQLISQVPGSSAYFLGGLCAYQNQIKTKILAVDDRLIAQHGVVSEPVVAAMLKGGQRLFGADICIATSGIAGPSRNDNDPEVGSLVLGVAIKDKTWVQSIHFKHLDRADFTHYASLKALEMAIEKLLD